MENLHLKNLKTDFETTLPTNQNYLNSVFKTKKLNLRTIYKLLFNPPISQ